MKYPIGLQSFPQIIEQGYTYIDKTDLIYSLADEGAVYFLTRPGRFGKSLLISTIKAYFEGRKELFAGLKIAELEQDWHTHKVFVLDFNGANYTKPGTLERRLNRMLCEWEAEYGIKTNCPEQYGIRLIAICEAACKQSGRRVVVLFDDYDKPLLSVFDRDQELFEKHRETLQSFLGALKSADEWLKFVLVTGLFKFPLADHLRGGFNHAYDISMTSKYNALCGFTDDELHSVFSDSIHELAQREDCTDNELRQRLKQRYGGYHFCERTREIYNPFSLLNALSKKYIENYWLTTGTSSCLYRVVKNHKVDFDTFIEQYSCTDELSYPITNIVDLLPMLYQSGYLTIKDYDVQTDLFVLDYPNDEVRSAAKALQE